jgi:hypothetical protein
MTGDAAALRASSILARTALACVRAAGNGSTNGAATICEQAGALGRTASHELRKTSRNQGHDRKTTCEFHKLLRTTTVADNEAIQYSW